MVRDMPQNPSPEFSATPPVEMGRRGLFIGAGIAVAGTLLPPGTAAAATLAGAAGPAAAPAIDLHPPAVDPSTQTLVPVPDSRVPAAVAALDTIVGEVMAATRVPGLSVAVVHRGEVLHAKGYGVRDVRTRVPVDEKTVFHLASVSKSLSATVVAGLVGRRAVAWTDPIVKHLPRFALADSFVTANVTLADLFSHSSGLPEHAGDLLEDLGYDQDYILNALRLEKLDPFRATYAYTNFGLTAAGVAAAAAAGPDWAMVADDVLFRPLGMSATSFRSRDFDTRSNRAAMHVRIGKDWVQKFTRDADAEAPAGGASSNVLDMARWMVLRLADGTWKGGKVIDADALTLTGTPHAVSSPPGSAPARTGFYGLGTNSGVDYTGRVRWSHSGAFAQGAATSYSLLPDLDLGIVVLTNGMPLGIPESIGAYFLDLVVGARIENDWSALLDPVFARLYVNPSVLAGKTPPAHPAPPRPDSYYTGTYLNDYYGPVQVVARGDGLHVLMPPRPTDYPLQHWDGDRFAFLPVGENALGITEATFAPGRQTDVAGSMRLEFYDATGLGSFTRR
ncbi:MAG: serine hydrolase [Actinomycetia bacterium]|nr:serine hydrolase [Actinomycetes bacterium]